MRPSLQCLIGLIVLHVSGCQGLYDYAMSVAGLKSLINYQGEFVNELTSYTEALQSKIDTIESFLAEVRAKKQIWIENPEDFVGNPLNSYSLVRRLHVDWSYFEAYMSEPVGPEHVENVQRLIQEIAPQEEDLQDAMKALTRMQSYYDLDEEHLAQGLIDGKQYNSQLSALDCYAMGQFCENASHYTNALNWFKAAVERFDQTSDAELFEKVYGLTVVNFYGQYAKALANKAFNREAISVMNTVADLDIKLWVQRNNLINTLNHLTTGAQHYKDTPDPQMIGCRDQFPVSTKMYCYYDYFDSHFLYVAPFKVELLSSEPFLALYHDVIYNNEIEELLSENPHKMSHDRTKENENSMKNIIVEKGPLNYVINERIVDMTGNDEAYDSDFQLINYGLGGHISLHSDAVPIYEQQQPNLFYPINTILFFLSDVPQGGATVFPELKIAVKPKKGAALMWNNVDSRLNVDHRLDHLSCPVLVGSKWTLVKWIYVEK